MGNRRLRDGDIFVFCAAEKCWGAGHIVFTGRTLYVVIYLASYESAPVECVQVDMSTPFLVGRTLDGLIFHGRWNVIGNAPVNMSCVPLPSNKYRVSGQWYVEDFFGKNSHAATEDEIALYDAKTTFAPIRFQNAFASHYGHGPWEDDFNRLTISHAIERTMREGI